MLFISTNIDDLLSLVMKKIDTVSYKAIKTFCWHKLFKYHKRSCRLSWLIPVYFTKFYYKSTNPCLVHYTKYNYSGQRMFVTYCFCR